DQGGSRAALARGLELFLPPGAEASSGAVTCIREVRARERAPHRSRGGASCSSRTNTASSGRCLLWPDRRLRGSSREIFTERRGDWEREFKLGPLVFSDVGAGSGRRR